MLMTTILIVVSIIALPVSLLIVSWLSRKPPRDADSRRRSLRRAIVGHAIVFAVVYCGVMLWAADSTYGQHGKSAEQGAPQAVASSADGLSVGDGLGMLGVALATGLSVLGAGYAVAVVGSAALGAIAEKPELFGRTLIFVGLAEGLAIYGLIVSILILGRLG